MPILRLQDFFFCQNQRNIFLSVNWSWQIIIVVAHLPNDVIDHFEICKILETFYHLFYKLVHHSVEKWKIYSHWRKISSNQLFSNFFSKTVTFTKFLSKKCEREFLVFPHSLTVWKLHKFSLTLFCQKFRETNGFTKEIIT